MTNFASEGWYIVKQPSQQCEIISVEAFFSLEEKTAADTDSAPEKGGQKWGPFETQQQAIAKRVGLIRAGKCKPS